MLLFLASPAAAGDGSPATSSTPVEQREPAPSWVRLAAEGFRPVEGPSSGPAVYYEVVSNEECGSFLRGSYRPGLETVAMGAEVPESLRARALKLRWRWRILAFPEQGDECTPGRGDSAASVSAAFKRGLKWYILKYVWSAVAPLHAVCDKKRGLLLARDTIVLERGGALGEWRTEEIDLRRDFIAHFAKGDPRADVPELMGIAVMTDGDQTHAAAAADWADIELAH